MPRWSIRGSTLAILCVAQFTTACTAARPGVSAAGSAAPVAASAVASPVAMTASAAPRSPSSVEPPVASLAVEGGDPVAGQLGSFTWNARGSDSPWLPGTPLNVGTGERLTVTLADDVAVTDWSARQVPAGTVNGSGGVPLGGGPAPVTFAAPGPGSWSVQVVLRFDGGLGSAAYYWRVTVR